MGIDIQTYAVDRPSIGSWAAVHGARVVIAASVLLLAAEAARGRDTLTTRHPVGVAFVFGLVHGFGFAGALTELTLPEASLLGTVLTFNLGVEVGQLGVLAGAMLVARALGRWVPKTLVAYVIGIPAGVWTVERAVAWWG